MSRDFSQWTSTTTPKFSLSGIDTHVRLLDVHDGDTIAVAMDVFGAVWQFSIRLVGIDAPEMTSHDVETKKKAEMARMRLLKLLAPDVKALEKHMTRGEMQASLQKGPPVMIRISCKGMDKYGRVLADVFCHDSQNSSQVLLSEGLVQRYDGGTKLPW